MFGELPKLFDRNFVISFFLPAIVMATLGWMVLADFNVTASPWSQLKEIESLLAMSLAVGLVWLLAVALMAVNRPILRILEGYPYRWLAAPMQWWFRRRVRPVLQTQSEVEAARAQGKAEPPTSADHGRRLFRASQYFPDAEEWILPTLFGNTFRAIEVYSRVVYGLDSIPAWPRLHALMPESFRQRLAEAEAQLNFSINMLFAGASAALLWGALALWMRTMPGSLLTLVVAVVLAIVARMLAGSALISFGDHVKAAFDLYRGDLAKQMGLELPRNAEMEREMWLAVSRMMVFRSQYAASQLTRFRSHDRPK